MKNFMAVVIFLSLVFIGQAFAQTSAEVGATKTIGGVTYTFGKSKNIQPAELVAVGKMGKDDFAFTGMCSGYMYNASVGVFSADFVALCGGAAVQTNNRPDAEQVTKPMLGISPININGFRTFYGEDVQHGGKPGRFIGGSLTMSFSTIFGTK